MLPAVCCRYLVIFQNYARDLEAVQKLYEKHKSVTGVASFSFSATTARSAPAPYDGAVHPELTLLCPLLFSPPQV
jgi:hypothetical protein